MTVVSFEDYRPVDRERLARAKQALRDARERGEARLHGTRRSGDPGIEWGNELPGGHVMDARPAGPVGPRCLGCGRPWTDALLTCACARGGDAA